MLENVENCVRTKNSLGFSLTETEVPLLDEAASQKVIHGEDVEEPGKRMGEEQGSAGKIEGKSMSGRRIREGEGVADMDKL